jgi:hypothetical protein
MHVTDDDIQRADQFVDQSLAVLRQSTADPIVIVTALLNVAGELAAADVVAKPLRVDVYRRALGRLSNAIALAGVPVDARGN